MKAMSTACLFSLAFSLVLVPSIARAQFWEPVAGPFGGEVLSLETTQSGDFLAGVKSATLYRSTDDGITWTKNSFPFVEASVGAISRKPGSNVILAATQNYPLRSTDDGLTWKFTQGGDVNAIREFVYQPSTMYWYAATDWDGVYRSTDDGVSWSQVDSGLTTLNMSSIGLDETGNVLLAGTTMRGLFRSTNNGTSWIETNSGLDDKHIYDILRTPGGCFVSTYNGIYKTSGGSWGWSRVTDPWIVAYSLYFDSLSSELFAGMMPGLLHSTDGGGSWWPYGTGLPFQMYAVQALTRSHNGTMLAGLPGPGVFRSADGGAHWVRSTAGIVAQNIQTLEADASGNLYAGTEHGMLFRSSDNGATWDSLFNVSCPIRQVLIAGQKVYFGTYGTGVRMSTDGGNTFSTNSICEAVGQTISALVGDPSGGELFVGTNHGVYHTTNDGMVWDKVNTGLADSNITALTLTPTGRLFCGTASGLVFTSSDKGSNWAKADSGVSSGGGISCFAPTTNRVFVGTYGGIFSTADSGRYWQPAGPNSNTTLALTAAKNGDLFACTYQGPYRSSNGGVTWEHLVDGFVGNSARALAVTADGYAFVSTDGNGIFRSVQKVVVAVEPQEVSVPIEYRLEQNWPNPFNPLTIIKYTVGGVRDQGPGIRKISLVVYDLLGRQVATLVNEGKAPGSYEVRFNGSGLSSGVYFYRLSAGPFVETRKMMLVK